MNSIGDLQNMMIICLMKTLLCDMSDDNKYEAENFGQ